MWSSHTQNTKHMWIFAKNMIGSYSKASTSSKSSSPFSTPFLAPEGIFRKSSPSRKKIRKIAKLRNLKLNSIFTSIGRGWLVPCVRVVKVQERPNSGKGGWSWSLYLLKWKLPAAHPVVCVGVLSPRVSSHSPVPACLESEMDVAPFGLPGLFQITTVCSQTIFAYLHSNNICTLPLIQSIMNTSLDASLLRAPLYGANNAHTAQGFWGT